MKYFYFSKLNLFFVIVICMAFDTLFAKNTYYASPKGDDDNDGSINSPWFKIEKSIRRISPGDTLLLRGGMYSEGEIYIRGDEGGANGLFKSVIAYPGEIRFCINSPEY